MGGQGRGRMNWGAGMIGRSERGAYGSLSQARAAARLCRCCPRAVLGVCLDAGHVPQHPPQPREPPGSLLLSSQSYLIPMPPRR